MEVNRAELESAAGFKDGYIPEWLLVEVLIRLPVKLVFRLKLVSKQWFSIISHPSFPPAYVHRASSSPQQQRWAFISYHMHVDGSYIPYELPKDVYSCNIESPGCYALPHPSTQQPQKVQIGNSRFGNLRYDILQHGIFGVSNGLVFYGPKILNKTRTCSICNPVTGQWIALPPQSSHFKHGTQETRVIKGFITHVESNVLMSYRVVCLYVRGGRKVISIDVFNSEKGEWKEFNVDIDHAIQVSLYKSPAVLNGILHWITHEHGLLAYDPYRGPDCLRFVELPKDRNPRFDNGNSSPSICDVHQGRLRYFEVCHKNTPPLGFSGLRVWMQNDYKSGDWSLLHRVSFADISCDGIFSGYNLEPTPLSFHPFDANIVYLGYGNAILSYNLENRKMEAHRDPSCYSRKLRDSSAWWWTLLFVIPPWPISIIPPASSRIKCVQDQ